MQISIIIFFCKNFEAFYVLYSRRVIRVYQEALAGVDQLVRRCPVRQGLPVLFWSGHVKGLWSQSLVGSVQEAAD